MEKLKLLISELEDLVYGGENEILNERRVTKKFSELQSEVDRIDKILGFANRLTDDASIFDYD